MRVIGGRFGGRILKPSMKKWPTRPTTDIAKEALYNVLSNMVDLEEVHAALDLFGGTGMHSLELISRGCTYVTYVDQYRPAVAWIKDIRTTWQIESELEVICSDYKRFIKAYENTRKFDLIFADPPYAMRAIDGLAQLIIEANILSDKGLLVIEHDQTTNYQQNKWFEQERKYGQSRFSFFRVNQPSDS